jgi:hypothetical protein
MPYQADCVRSAFFDTEKTDVNLFTAGCTGLRDQRASLFFSSNIESHISAAWIHVIAKP